MAAFMHHFPVRLFALVLPECICFCDKSRYEWKLPENRRSYNVYWQHWGGSGTMCQRWCSVQTMFAELRALAIFLMSEPFHTWDKAGVRGWRDMHSWRHSLWSRPKWIPPFKKRNVTRCFILLSDYIIVVSHEGCINVLAFHQNRQSSWNHT